MLSVCIIGNLMIQGHFLGSKSHDVLQLIDPFCLYLTLHCCPFESGLHFEQLHIKHYYSTASIWVSLIKRLCLCPLSLREQRQTLIVSVSLRGRNTSSLSKGIQKSSSFLPVPFLTMPPGGLTAVSSVFYPDFSTLPASPAEWLQLLPLFVIFYSNRQKPVLQTQAAK